ncbi:DUF6965 family protein [Paradesertivirga mongoliensis]|uniref:DUF6965 family protein n=1 Tax=Paradesertivirga mongoliensis TaxID=2100740 RepID=A0ABW4ZP80_9SPHI|nr:hypothetical protein [Pedobacter mongoliensis]
MSIAQIEQYFATTPIPKEVQLNRSTRIVDTELFLSTSLAYAKKHGEKSPGYEHLMQMYTHLTKPEGE